MKDHAAYQAIPTKVARWRLHPPQETWQSFFCAALATWEEDASQFLRRLSVPRYKHKQQDRKKPLWQQDSDMGRRNNQNIVSVPHARFVAVLAHKAGPLGIQVTGIEDIYTVDTLPL